MDIHKILNGVKTLTDYIAASQNIVYKCPDLKIHLNMSTVLNLKKVRSLEIEYFNKCEDNGAAFVVFDGLLKQPPSKTWGLLGKELISMLQYWLDAVRRHLISHSYHWWTFLKALLRFIKEIKSKDPLLLNIIVEQTTECLLDISCNSRLDEIQRQQVLYTVNEYCAESSRELRSRMRERLTGYFIKLSTILSTCGHLPAQMGILEVLLRWLVGRYDPQVRRDAAVAWFPHQLFRREAVELFLERPWREFFQDARDFLNIHNANCPSRVTSVVCKKLIVGGVELINGPQSRATWLDINAASRSLTVSLEPRALPGAAAPGDPCHTLAVAAHNVRAVQLYRASSETVVWVQTIEPLQLSPAGAGCDVTATIRSHALPDLNKALNIVFADKYQLLFNLDTVASSPNSGQDNPVKSTPRKLSSSEEDRRSAIPLRRRKHSGFIVRSRKPLAWNSPSTASTSSLAQLHDKLAALPHIAYSKEPIKVSVEPELSMVREVSECEERSSNLSTTSRSRHFGVCQRQSDGEVHNNAKKRNISPVTQHKDKPVSLMIAATLGSADQSIISDTYEKLNRDNAEIDLLDLLVKEAFQTGKEGDSGIIIDNKTQDSGVIENTPLEKQTRTKKFARNRKAKCTIVSNSTTDESNTEVVNELQCYVSERKKPVTTKHVTDTIIQEPHALDAEAVDAFFSQHIAENSAGHLVISPTLAKKINETSSEASENIIGELDNNNFIFESEIIECLNYMVDEVCSNFDKCAEILRKENDEKFFLQNAHKANVNDKNKPMDAAEESNNVSLSDDTRKITLKFQKTKKRVTTKNNKQRKNKDDIVSDSTMVEENTVLIENINTNSLINKNSTPLTRKKRKLYSPKDHDNDNDKMEEFSEAKIESMQSYVNKTPIATCYKEIEMARKNISRIPRKSRSSSETIMSPRTRKHNDIFDKLKEKADNDEKITLVNKKSNKKDVTVYNFSSDSEDEDFKTKRNELQKRVSSTSLNSTVSKRGRLASRVNYSEINNSSADESKRKPKRRKVVKQTKPRSRKVNIEPSIDLIDERMRETAPEVLETSFVKEIGRNNKVQDPEPVIKQAPAMETIPDNNNDETAEFIVVELKSQKPKRSKLLQIKKEKGSNKKAEKSADIIAIKKEKGINKQDTVKNVQNKHSGSESPLPGLVVETEKTQLDDMTASVEANMLQRLKKIYTEGPDVAEEIDLTQNLILKANKTNRSGGINNDVNLDLFDFVDISTNEKLNSDVEKKKRNQSMLDPEEMALDTIAILDAPSEKSIPTDGKSPITGHNDHDESPPNMTLLQQNIEERDLEIQDMNQSMAEFFVQLRNGLQANKTPRASTDKSRASPVLPVTTRLSSKECAVTPKSSISTPKVVLSRLSSKEIQKYVSPVKSKTSSNSCTPEVVLERISSDEINKWLPMPCINRDRYERTPKKYETRLATKKTTGVAKKTPEKQVKNKIKSVISPIKLSFDINDDKASSCSSNKENDDIRNLCKTSMIKTRSMRTQNKNNTTDKSEDTQSVSQKSLGTEKIESTYRKQDCVKNSSSENLYKSPVVENELDIDRKHTNRQERDINKNDSENTSGGSESVASVNDWFRRNVALRTPSKADTNLARDIIGKVVETLETTLEEIHQSTGRNLAFMLLENQKRLSRLQEDSRELDKRTLEEIMAAVECKWAERDRKLKEMMDDYDKDQKQRACELTRGECERKCLMVRLLKEDLQAVLNFQESQNK